MFAKIVLAFALFGSLQAFPWEAIPREDAGWYSRHEGFVNETRARGDEIQVLFYGDSITDAWRSTGKPVFDVEYTPYGAANYGIGGDKVENVVWRVVNGEVDGLNPKVLILKIGTNNGGDTTDNVVIGITSLINELRQRLPNTKILLLGVLPRSDTEAWFSRVYDINIKISHISDNANVFWLDMFNQFSVSWPVVDPALFTSDKLHLALAGYQRWADTMRASFRKLVA